MFSLTTLVAVIIGIIIGIFVLGIILRWNVIRRVILRDYLYFRSRHCTDHKKRSAYYSHLRHVNEWLLDYKFTRQEGIV